MRFGSTSETATERQKTADRHEGVVINLAINNETKVVTAITEVALDVISINSKKSLGKYFEKLNT